MEFPADQPHVGTIIDKIGKLTGEVTCPCCQGREWLRWGGDSGAHVVLQMGVGGTPDAPSMNLSHLAGAVALYCTHCGFLRMHAVDPSWLGVPT